MKDEELKEWLDMFGPYSVEVEVLHDKCVPTWGSKGAAGIDLRANLLVKEGYIVIPPGGEASFDVGIKVAIPVGWCGIVMPRSGLGRKYKVKLDNTIGLIDSDYRGVIGISITNTGTKEMQIEQGDRICQMAIIPHLGLHNAELKIVSKLTETDRGENGWGSSGVK